MPKLLLMKDFYPDSLITFSAAITEACLLIKGKNININTGGKCDNLKLLKLNTVKENSPKGVGINFADTLTGKCYSLPKIIKNKFGFKDY